MLTLRTSSDNCASVLANNIEVWPAPVTESSLTKAKYGQNPYRGPYEVLETNDNGTVLLKMGPLIDTVNIRNIKPYIEYAWNMKQL